MNFKNLHVLWLLMFMSLSAWHVGAAQANDVTVECRDSGNCADLVYDNHNGQVNAVCHPSATNPNLPVQITLNGTVYTGTLDCGGPPTNGPWTVSGPGACTQACGGGTQFFTVTCEYDNCTGPRPADSQSCNTQACANCNADNWTGDQAENICTGQTGTQQNECGDTRQISGTWEPQDWSPHPSQVCSTETFFQRTSCGETREVQGTLDCGVTWHWLRPASPEPLVSANSESDYSSLRVSGDLFYPIAGRGFFDVNQIRSARVLLENGTDSFEYDLALGSITFTDRMYDFVLDVSVLQQATPVGGSGPQRLIDGTWDLDVLFEYRPDASTAYEWIRSGLGGGFVIDSTAPTATYVHREGSEPEALEFEEGAVTNEPGYVWIACEDVGPAGCLGDLSDRDGDSEADDYAPFLVKGNFCDDNGRCDDDGVKTFEVCDRVDNCTELEVILDHYDPIAPSALDFVMKLEAAGQVIGSSIKASSDYYPNLEYVDPSLVSISVTPSVVGRQAYVASDVFEQLFDVDACGDPSVAPFALNGASDRCILQNPNYPPTCEDLNSCPDPCPAGFVWDRGLDRCTAYAAAPTQTYTGTWTANQPDACSAACGQSATVNYGTVTCSNTDCDPADRPAPLSQNCAATAACAATYTGTWSTTPAPACSTACGLAASEQSGTVTCSNSDCDPAAEPAVPTRSCNATAACSTAPTTNCTDFQWDFDGDCDSGNTPMCNRFNLADIVCGNNPNCRAENMQFQRNTCSNCAFTADRCITSSSSNSNSSTPPAANSTVTYTGTWSTTPAPACSTACGLAASEQSGTVTCSNTDCDPAAEPAVPNRSCNATAACAASNARPTRGGNPRSTGNNTNSF